MTEKKRNAWGFISGLVLLVAIGLVSLYLSELFKKVIHAEWLNAVLGSNVIIAVVLGMVINNLLIERIKGLADFLAPGLEAYEFLLKIGIVFLGARILISDLLKLGGLGLGMVVVEILFSIFFVTLIARLFKLDEKIGSLLSVGVGICGVSAIIGTTGAINAKREEANYAIAVILIFGAAAMIVYPLIGSLLHMNQALFGVWAGLAVDNTAEAIATGQLYDQVRNSSGAIETATIAKMCRNALMGFVILGFALYYASKGMAKQITHKGLFLWQKFPKFVLGFVLFAILASIGIFSGKNSAMLSSIKSLEHWAFLFTFAGVGLRTRFSDMAKTGWKPFVVGIAAETSVALVTLIMVLLLGGLLTLKA